MIPTGEKRVQVAGFTDQRPALRQMMRELAEEGGSSPAGKRAIIAPGRLPDMAPVEVTGKKALASSIERSELLTESFQ